MIIVVSKHLLYAFRKACARRTRIVFFTNIIIISFSTQYVKKFRANMEY